ncbi:glycosyltransferase [Dokdonella sp.]|uniref:glycosyltransferase n=1 Tax=Dokdonella sp. TaxID=2291710 RepID=UPI003C6B3B38
MRVLHLGKYYQPHRGGIERYLQDLAEWSVDHGHHVGALVHQPPGQWRSTHDEVNGVDLWRAGCIGAPLYTPLSPTYPLRLGQALEAIQPDVLHLHMPNPSCFAALLSPRARALPWIVHWHADVSTDMPDWRVRAAYRIYRPFEQWLLNRAAAIVATSQAYLAASSALAPWAAKARVIPLGIRDRTRDSGQAPMWPQGNGLRILGVGRLSHYKGFAVLLEAMSRLPGVRLVLIGSGEQRDSLQAMACRLGVSDRVSFIADCEEADLQAAYVEAEVLVLPSLDRSEAFGLVLLEAMRAGLATIASDIPGSGVGQVIENETTGLLVEPGKAVDLARAIDRLDSDPAMRAAMGTAGRLRWERHFTLQDSAQAVHQLYGDSSG